MAAPAREPSFDILRVEFRNRVPGLVLHELIGGDYQPAVAAAGDDPLVMSEPFAFSVRPAELLGAAG